MTIRFRISQISVAAVTATTLLVGGLLGLVVVPALADGQVRADDQALVEVGNHRATIDAALQQFLNRSAANTSEADDQRLSESSQTLAQYEAARNTVTADETALNRALQPAWLGPLALAKADNLRAARQRTDRAVNALAVVNQVLDAAIDQERLQQGFFIAVIAETKMLTAIDDQQYVQVDGFYAEADRGLRVAEALAVRPDQSPGTRPILTAIRAIIDETDQYATDLLRDDLQNANLRHAAMRAGYGDLARATDQAAITANDVWNDRTFQPLITVYHRGLTTALNDQA